MSTSGIDTEQLSILEDDASRKMFQEIIRFMEEHRGGQTRIQIERFVLNDIEYPSPYGKFQQATVELAARYDQIVHLYYDISKTKIEIGKKHRPTPYNPDDTLDEDLRSLELSELQYKLHGLQKKLQDIVREAEVFYEVYQKYPQFHNPTPEDLAKFEADFWARKALNMPHVFEERYGAELLMELWGEDVYKRFRERRQQAVGVLMRDLAQGAAVMDAGPSSKFLPKDM